MRRRQYKLMHPSQGILVLGAGRSGTSYLASLLHAYGVNMGRRLLPAEEINPRGFFEDEDFIDFHRDLLTSIIPEDSVYFAERGTLVPERFDFSPTSLQKERAKALVADRAKGSALWGWKDPRTAYFAEFWADILPHASAVVIFRHPLEVLHSHVKRAKGLELQRALASLPLAYAHAYGKILGAIGKLQGRAVVVHASREFSDADFRDRIVRALLGKVSPKGSLPAFHPEEFSSLCIEAPIHRFFLTAYPAVAPIWEKLCALSLNPPELPQIPPSAASFSEDLVQLGREVSFDPASVASIALQVALARSGHPPTETWKRITQSAYSELRDIKTWSLELQTAKCWHEQQAASYKTERDSLLEERAALISRAQLGAASAEWHAERDRLSEEKREISNRLAEAERQIEEQKRWIADREEAIVWRDTQLAEAKNNQQSLQQELAELREWNASLEEANRWHELTRERMAGELDKLQQLLAEQKRWIDELGAGLTWTKEQLAKVEQERDTLRTELTDLRKWNQEITAASSSQLEQIESLQNQYTASTALLKEQKAWIEQQASALEWQNEHRQRLEKTLQEAQGWHAAQTQSLERQLADTTAQNMEQRVWIEQQAAALEWHNEHRQHLEKALQEVQDWHTAQMQSAQLQLAKAAALIQEQKTWIEDQAMGLLWHNDHRHYLEQALAESKQKLEDVLGQLKELRNEAAALREEIDKKEVQLSAAEELTSQLTSKLERIDRHPLIGFCLRLFKPHERS